MDISAVSSEPNSNIRQVLATAAHPRTPSHPLVPVILIDITLANILRYLTPHDCIEFLISTKFTYEARLPWWILLCWLKLERYVSNTSDDGIIQDHIQTPRSLVSHTVRNLGYACNQWLGLTDTKIN